MPLTDPADIHDATSASEEPVPASIDIPAYLGLVAQAYGWTITNEGCVAGLVAGDMGYEDVGTQFGALVAVTFAHLPRGESYEFQKQVEALMTRCADVISKSSPDLARQAKLRVMTAEALRPDNAREAWLRHVYEGASRALCMRDGIDPDEIISDGGHLAWQLQGYEEARKMLGEPKPFKDGKVSGVEPAVPIASPPR